MTTERYIVMDRSTRGPTIRNFGARASNYRRVAVVEVAPSLLAASGVTEPCAIAKTARGVNRVVETWESLFAGSTERCAYQRALSEAYDLARALNEQERAQ